MRNFVVGAAVVALALAPGCERTDKVSDHVRDRPRRGDAPDSLSPDIEPVPAPIAAEGPDVSGPALWDETPSLGGVWVAHPDVVQPSRVWISRADSVGAVAGWLLRRDAGKGLPLQVSSEAASALGLTAGEAVALTVEPLDAAE